MIKFFVRSVLTPTDQWQPRVYRAASFRSTSILVDQLAVLALRVLDIDEAQAEVLLEDQCDFAPDQADFDRGASFCFQVQLDNDDYHVEVSTKPPHIPTNTIVFVDGRPLVLVDDEDEAVLQIKKLANQLKVPESICSTYVVPLATVFEVEL